MQKGKHTTTEKIMSIVTRTIYENHPIFREDLSKLTGLNISSIVKLTRRLIKDGVVCESPSSESTGGRRPNFLSINPDWTCSAGIVLDSDSIVGVLTDVLGNVKKESSRKLPDNPSSSLIIEHVFSIIGDILRFSVVAEQAGSAETYIGILTRGIFEILETAHVQVVDTAGIGHERTLVVGTGIRRDIPVKPLTESHRVGRAIERIDRPALNNPRNKSRRGDPLFDHAKGRI